MQFPALSFAATLALAACGTSDTTETQTTCPAATLPAVSHSGYLSASETWSADAPHVITSDLTVPKGTTLTIASCAEVRLDPGTYLIVQGQLVARATTGQTIRLLRNGAAAFAALRVQAPGSADLARVEITGGGATNMSDGASVVVEGEGLPVATPLRVEQVTVKDSGGYGIYLDHWAGFASGSTGLTVTGSGQSDSAHPFPMRISLNAVNTVPPGSYTGNATDAIQLIGESPHYTVEVDEQIHDRGVPYQVGGNGMFGIIKISGSGEPRLTIDAGVTIRFFSSSSNVGGLVVGATGSTAAGALVAVGTAAAPIRFTGVTSTPGSWEGIRFDHRRLQLPRHLSRLDRRRGGLPAQQHVPERGRLQRDHAPTRERLSRQSALPQVSQRPAQCFWACCIAASSWLASVL